MSQSTKLLAQLGAVLVVGAGLAGYAYFGVFKNDRAVEEKKAHDEHLFATTKAGDAVVIDGGSLKTEFTKLSVTNQGETTVLERVPGGAWVIVSPMRAAVDALVVDTLTSQLQQAKFKTTLEENPTEQDLAKYGLSPPQFVVEATAQLKSGTQSVRLEGGIENTFDGTIYMRRNGEKPVYLAEGGVRWSLSKSTFDLRKKEVLAVDEAQLQSIEVVTANNSYRLERDSAGVDKEKSWKLTKPIQVPADVTTVAALVGMLKNEKATAFLSSATSLPRPTTTATFNFTDGKTVKFELGPLSADAGVKAGYARREDENGALLAEIKSPALTLLDRNPLDLRDRTIVSFKRELVTKVLFHAADGTEFTVEQDPATDAGTGMPTWHVDGAGQSRPAKTFKVTAVLWLMSTIKGIQFVDEKAVPPAVLGLDGPKARFIAMLDASGKELARFTIGNEVPNKPATYFVRGTRPQPIEVDGARFTELPSKATDLMDLPDAG